MRLVKSASLIAGMVVLGVLSSCNGRENTNDKHEVDVSLVGVTLSGDELHGDVICGIYRNRLFVECNDGVHCYEEFEVDGDSLIRKHDFGTRGRSGLEFDIPLGKVVGDTLFIADMQGYGGMYGKLVAVPLSDGSSDDIRRWKIRDLSPFSDIICGSGFDVMPDGRLVVLGGPLDSDDLLTFMDIENMTTAGLKYWFDDGKEASEVIKHLIYTPNASIKVNGDKLMYACGEGRFLDIVTLDGDRVASRNTVYGIYPEYTFGANGMDYDFARVSYRGMNVCATDQYVYVQLAMYKIVGGRFEPESYKGYPGEYFDEVEIYDWDGNFVRCIGTDKPFRSMAVSGDDSFLYVMSLNLETDEAEVVRYSLR